MKSRDNVTRNVILWQRAIADAQAEIDTTTDKRRARLLAWAIEIFEKRIAEGAAWPRLRSQKRPRKRPTQARDINQCR